MEMKKSATTKTTDRTLASYGNGDKSVPKSEFEICEKDLPMSSNTDEVHVIHYLFNMKFDFYTKVMTGSATLFLTVNRLTMGESNSQDFGCKCRCPQNIMLDSCALNVSNVFYLRRLTLSSEEIEQRKFWLLCSHSNSNMEQRCAVPLKKLNFEVSKWSTTIRDFCPCDELKSSTISTNEDRPNNSLQIVHVIRIDYETLSESPSLHWRPAEGFHYHSNDSDQPKYAVYTPGSLVNNRGLFPCQDAPSAFATWEAIVYVQRPYQALLTSEHIGRMIRPSEMEEIGTQSAGEMNQDEEVHYFYSTHLMPISTFAIMVGVFDSHPICTKDESFPLKSGSGLMPARLLTLSHSSASSCKMNWDRIRQYTRNVLQVAYSTFGPHPYPRLDLVIMPTCFHTLGLASPYLIFLSPNNFVGDESNPSTRMLYYARIAHEISHAWFGLAIGAKDWNEVWLSEGFATFAEDVLYSKACMATATTTNTNSSGERQIRQIDLDSELELKSCILLHTLKSELGGCTELSSDDRGQGQDSCERGNAQTQHQLQVLVPNSETSCSNAVQNGLMAMRQFIQMPYLKGFFFLRYLCNLVGGPQQFLPFLKSYIQIHSGHLVTSEEFIKFYSQSFQDALKKQGLEQQCKSFYKDWFYNAELPASLCQLDLSQMILNPTAIPNDDQISMPIIAFKKCQHSFTRINQALTHSIKEISETEKSQKAKYNCKDGRNPQNLNSYELILLFERILQDMNNQSDEDGIQQKFTPESIIAGIDFIPETQNPEVLHRWCEILLKAVIQSPDSIHNPSRLAFLTQFLLKNPAMGLYLYGELMISEVVGLQELAKSLYRQQLEVLDPEAKQVLEEMLF